MRLIKILPALLLFVACEEDRLIKLECVPGNKIVCDEGETPLFARLLSNKSGLSLINLISCIFYFSLIQTN